MGTVWMSTVWMSTVWMSSAWADAPGPHDPTCGQPAWGLARPSPRRGQRTPAGDKAVRDAYDTPNLAVSDNFAVHWGNDHTVSAATIDALLDAAEAAWDIQLGDLGHDAPVGTDTTRFNAYIGDTGDGAPSSGGAAGYYTLDPQGWPMIVIAHTALDDRDGAAITIAHEFYHALQGATGRFDTSGTAGWFAEATAEWAALRTDRDNPRAGGFLYAYALTPYLPLATWDPSAGGLTALHPYGAFVFPAHVAAVGGDRLIPRTWQDPGIEPDPLEVLRTVMAEDGLDLDTVWLDHVARAATWDFAEGTANVGAIAERADALNLDPEAGSYSRSGTNGIRRSDGQPPGHYGFNAIALREPDAGDLEVEIIGDRLGTEGSPATFGAWVVLTHLDAPPQYVPVAFDDVYGTAWIEAAGDAETIWLMVGAHARDGVPAGWATEGFPFDYALTVHPETEVEALDLPEATGCGCRTAGSSGSSVAWVGWAAIATGLIRRRRRRVP